MSVNRTTWPAPATPLGLLDHGGISTFSHIPHSLGIGSFFTTTTNWPSANLAVYVPIEVSAPYLVAKIAWANGSAVAGNVDAGIYSMAGTLLLSTGATAQAGTSQSQSVDVTDMLLMPGNYWIGILNTSTGRLGYYAATNAGFLQAVGCVQEATGGTLPATMTPATMAQVTLPLVALIADTRIG